MIKVEHIRNKCIGCGFCVDIAPMFWDMDFADGKANLFGAQKKKDIFFTEIFEDDRALVRRSADACPVKCIKI